jgi:hypothetical protein
MNYVIKLGYHRKKKLLSIFSKNKTVGKYKNFTILKEVSNLIFLFFKLFYIYIYPKTKKMISNSFFIKH